MSLFRFFTNPLHCMLWLLFAFVLSAIPPKQKIFFSSLPSGWMERVKKYSFIHPVVWMILQKDSVAYMQDICEFGSLSSIHFIPRFREGINSSNICSPPADQQTTSHMHIRTYTSQLVERYRDEYGQFDTYVYRY